MLATLRTKTDARKILSPLLTPHKHSTTLRAMFGLLYAAWVSHGKCVITHAQKKTHIL